MKNNKITAAVTFNFFLALNIKKIKTIKMPARSPKKAPRVCDKRKVKKTKAPKSRKSIYHFGKCL